MKILVLGGDGFCGWPTSLHLSRRGHDVVIAANFARLGFHHGFALSVTLPRAVGEQRAAELLYTGARIGGDEALRIGLCDRLVPAGELRAAAVGP